MTELLTAFAVVFVAELGDKTQLAAVGFGAKHRLAPVLLGVFAAYAATNLVSVVIGGILGASLPTRAIGIGGGLLFLAFAVWNALDKPEPDDEGETVAPAGRHVVLSVAAAMFIAEMGDKTMLATATLAAKESPVLVWIGATLGITASGVLGVLVGRAAGARLPERTIRIASTLMFAVVGVVLLVTAIVG